MNRNEFELELRSTEQGKLYIEFILEIQAEKRTLCLEQGYERHHIFPRKLGGNVRDNNNLVKLMIFEHIKAHYYLACVFGGSMLYAFNMLVNGKFDSLDTLDQISLEQLQEWSEIRKRAAHRPHTLEARRKISESNKGRLHRKWTEEERRMASERRKGQRAWNKGIRLRDLGKTHHISEEGYKHILEASKKRRGMVRMSQGSCVRMVSSEDVSRYESEGWIRGGGSTCQKGSVHINKDGVRKMVVPEKLSEYLEDGWVLGRGIPGLNRGRVCSEATRKKMSDRRKGTAVSEDVRRKCSERSRGRVHINKDGVRKFVSKESLKKYLESGWSLGRALNTKVTEK